MFYIYILYSVDFDKYYIGYTSDYLKRLECHNTSELNKYTSKYRPWVLKVFLNVVKMKVLPRNLKNLLKHKRVDNLLKR